MLNASTATAFPLFDVYPRLADRLDRLVIGGWPTPAVRAARFAEQQGLRSFYVKREDLSHPQAGGNKVRGLEFLLAPSVTRGRRRIVTVGSLGSHHVARTSYHGRLAGLDTVAVVVPQPLADYVRHNVWLATQSGARYVVANYATIAPRLAFELARPALRRGGRAYFIPPGGTSPLACIGHVNAAFELKRQIDNGELPEPDSLFVPLGSLGTAAGLAAGCRLAGLRTRVVGIVVSYRWFCTPGRWARLARGTLGWMRGLDEEVPAIDMRKSELTAETAALGGGYAQFTEEAASVARQFFETEQIRLDGTYAGKALDGALRFIRAHGLEDRTHLFWCTYSRTAESLPPDWAQSLPARLRAIMEQPSQSLDARFQFDDE